MKNKRLEKVKKKQASWESLNNQDTDMNTEQMDIETPNHPHNNKRKSQLDLCQYFTSVNQQSNTNQKHPFAPAKYSLFKPSEPQGQINQLIDSVNQMSL